MRSIMRRAASFLSTLPVRGATSGDAFSHYNNFNISIHAPREGSDNFFPQTMDVSAVISIHAPREGSDSSTWVASASVEVTFLSTLPVRGATAQAVQLCGEQDDFYPRSP